MNYQILLKNELEGVYKANAETKSNKGISGELRVLTEKIRQSTKADSEEMKQKKLASIQVKLRAGKKLTVDKTLLQFSYPIDGIIYMPSTVTSLCIMSYAMAEVYNVQISIAWIVLATITAVLLAIAAPPVPGAGLMLYTILFAQLGIPAEAILLSTAYEMIFDYPETGFNVLYLLVKTVDEAG